MRRQTNTGWLCYLFALILPAGLALAGAPLQAAVTPAEEQEAGRQGSAQIEARFGRLEDPVRLGRVETVGRRLEAAAGKKPGTFTFRLLKSRGFNALSLPGGIVYVMQGLVDGVSSDEELAAALAHEMEHTLLGHLRALLEDARRPSPVFRVAGARSGKAPRTPPVGAPLSGPSPREMEFAADGAAITLLARAGYPAESMLTLLGRIRPLDEARSGAPESAAGALAAHPGAPERMARVRLLLSEKSAPRE